MIRRHHSQRRTPRLLAASRNSAGSAMAPPITLNRMYHCVPRIISGLSQISVLSRKCRISTTATGKNRLAGKAARNCTIGWARSAMRGRSPIHTPIGTQISEAIAISTSTRSAVISAEHEDPADLAERRSPARMNSTIQTTEPPAPARAGRHRRAARSQGDGERALGPRRAAPAERARASRRRRG